MTDDRIAEQLGALTAAVKGLERQSSSLFRKSDEINETIGGLREQIVRQNGRVTKNEGAIKDMAIKIKEVWAHLAAQGVQINKHEISWARLLAFTGAIVTLCTFLATGITILVNVLS